MGLVSGIAVYVIIWWTVLFAVLPWGSRPPDQPEPGTEPGAPARPRLPAKFAVTTAIAAVIWLVVEVIILSGIISFRDMAREMWNAAP